MARRQAKGRGAKPRKSGTGPVARFPAGRAAAATEVDRLLDGLDTAMLAGNLRRAQEINAQLFNRRAVAAEALVERLIDGRARIPFLAFQLLEMFGGKRVSAHMRRIASEPRAPDIVRWGARRRAGWPEGVKPQARLEFLASLRDPDDTLVEAIAQAAGWWPPDAEILQEVIAYLVALPAEQRLALVQRAAAAQIPDIAWLLRALVHVDDPALQRLAIGELVRLRDIAAVGALSRLAQTTPNPDLRAEAESASRRLRIGPVDAPHADGDERRPWPAVGEVVMTEIDGDGGQAIMLTRPYAEGVATLVNIFHKDGWGIKDVHGLARALAEELMDTMLEPLQEEGLEIVEVDLAAVRGAIALAVQANAATGHPIPPTFELWEPFLHDTFPPTDDEPVLVPELDDSRYAGREDLMRASGDLLDHPMFQAWLFNPEEIAPLLAIVPPPKNKRMTDRQYRPLIEALIDDATRQRLRRRLRRQAWLLDQQGQEEDRDTALAVAGSLGELLGDVSKNPFLRGMIDVSIGNLLRVALPEP